MVSRPAPPTDTAPELDYPDSLDAGLLRIAGVCILASVMALLDGTVVSVAQRTFIAEFSSTQAVVAWTITGYTLGQATVIPLAGWASDRFGTKRLFMGAALWFTLGVAAVLDGVEHQSAHRISGDSRPGRRHAGAADPDHLDARSRPETPRQIDGSARHPDAPRPDGRSGAGWLADQRLRLGMDLPDQLAGRRDPAGARGFGLSEGSAAPVGGLRLRRNALAVPGIGIAAVRYFIGTAT